MLFEDEAKLLLKPGYMPLENGYYRLPNGQMYVAALIPMPGCRGKWIDWWLRYYLKDTNTFRKFLPEALYFKWDKKGNPGSYLGSSTYLETPMGDKISKSIRRFVDPAKYFDASKFQEAGIETIIYGEDFNIDGTLDHRVVQVVRHTNFGCEMRIRFWINNGTDEIAQLHLQRSMDGMLREADFLKTWAQKTVTSENYVGLNCKFCKSNEVIRNGMRKNDQRWLCKDCGHTFIDNQALPGMKYPEYLVASAVHDYYNGYPLRQICSEIEKTTSILPSTSSVYGWIKKLTEKALNEESAYHPLVGDSWILYKTLIGFKSLNLWLIYVIDMNTKFLLGAKLSNDMNIRDIQTLMLSAKEKAGKMPKIIMTNLGEENLHGLESTYGADSKLIRIAPITYEELNNNFGQLFPTMVKKRLRPRNDIDVNDSTQTILSGFVFHHNYISLCNASRGTPAEAARIESPYRDWLSVLRNAQLAPSISRGQ